MTGNQIESPQKQLLQSVQFVRGVGPRRAQTLARLGIRTAADLLFFFPRKYEDFTGRSQIHELELDQVTSVVGEVDDIDQTVQGNKHVLYVLIKQNACYLRGIWFNQEYLFSKFRIGQTVQLRGKVGERGGRLQMVHPMTTWIDDPEAVVEEFWQPVYPLTEGINQRQLRTIIADVITEYSPLVAEAIPDDLQDGSDLYDIEKAIEKIHFPKNEDEYLAARRRLVFQELLILQLALSMRRHSIRTRAIAPKLEMNPKIRARILGRLPFELRDSQLQVVDQIAADMGQPFPMNRLLHGEVGSGKTAVAVCAMLLAIANEHQSVLMAPTEILARQHVQTLNQLLAGSRVRVALCIGSQTAKQRQATRQSIESGDVDIIVGTTAVIGSKLNFKNLGLVVIDEQHKFGVRQRAQLKQAGFDPHYLVMTATPIPRTVTMTLFGDLDVSTLPDNHRSSHVKTYLGEEPNREKWWAFFKKKISEGRQGFVVAPFVDSKAKSDVQSAEELYEHLANGPLEEFRTALLHGKQAPDEKHAAMNAFASGETQVLIATGVIEVGIDVPNATVMTIESAERFGLSQLHQLRGRLGRGQHPGYVCAFPSDSLSSEVERLQAFAATDNGFDLAQIDLKLRGPGNLLSTKQTGFPPLKIADLIRDEEILIETRNCARQIIEHDPNLAESQHQRLRELVISRYAKALDMSDVG